MWITIYLKKKECRPVMVKAYPQYQSGRAIYCPDGKLGMATKSVLNTAVYCLQAPMKLADQLRLPTRNDRGRKRGPPREFIDRKLTRIFSFSFNLLNYFPHQIFG
ncbi:hypothetical protein TNCV_1374691 [Trichonephila clavipes]|nr:hypothetical protein TNCV_1374691 [Trichonephila clavipes]